MTSKIAWLVGASSGIGRALAFKLAERGWTVAISARNAAALQAMQNESSRLIPFVVDVTEWQSLADAFQQIETDLGELEFCLFNAGDYSPMPLEAFDVSLFQKLMDVNYMGVVNGLDCVIPTFVSRGRGQILLTASLAAYCGLPQSSPYSASKAAVLSMAESLHPELRRKGVLLRVVNPGFVKSPLTSKNEFEMPFLLEPEEAADAILRELSGTNFEIRFPKRFAWIMRILSVLPYRFYFWLTDRMIK